MKKFIFVALAALWLMPAKADAYVSEQVETFEVGASSYVVKGVHCSSGTPANVVVNTLMSGYRIAGYRIQNPSSNDIYIGHQRLDTTAPSNATTDDFSWVLKQWVLASMPLGRHKDGNTYTQFWCQAANGATSGQHITVEVFGYQ